MKTITIQERLHDQCINASSVNELMSITSHFTAEIVETDNIFLSIEKHWCGYGTWGTSTFANEYHFGKELAGEVYISGCGKRDRKYIKNNIPMDNEQFRNIVSQKESLLISSQPL